MDSDPEVRTTAGYVRGRRAGDVAICRGIPYAMPPVGERRFKAPRPSPRWDGVRDALEFGPPAPQVMRDGDTPAWAARAFAADDWLTLNVWTPEVSMNYRLGVEGFAHVAGAPDNRGILDQIAALQWIQENIAAFGGDPGTVTVFGESAGAGSVAALLVMPRAAGLFRRAIAQSVPGTYFSIRLAAAISAQIAAELGARATVEELADMPPRALLDATRAVVTKMPAFVDSWGPMTFTPTPFSPVVDGDVLPQSPWPALMHGEARGIELLVGHTRDEWRPFGANRLGQVSEQQAAVALKWLAPAPDGERAYRAAYPDATPAQIHELVHADWLMRMPSLHLAEAQHAGGGSAWLYELCWAFNAEDGASHALDVLLVLGTLDPDLVRRHPAVLPNAPGQVGRVSEQMRTEWLDFATGHPGWPPYDQATRSTRVYNAEPATGPYPEETSRQIWRYHHFDTLELPARRTGAGMADSVQPGNRDADRLGGLGTRG